MKKVLLLAQTPPPLHGQAIMQQYLVNDSWNWCIKEHLRLEYSDNIQQVGHFQFGKILKLFKLIFAIYKSSRKSTIDLIYYPPGGPNRIPLYRDVITLLFAKLFSKRIILHFHAGGINDLIEKLNPIELFFVKNAFKDINHVIVLLPWLQKEVTWFAPKNIYVVPNGIEDVAYKYSKCSKLENTCCNILFVGNLKEEKGIFILLSALAMLKKAGHIFKVKIMGEAHSTAVKERILKVLKLENIVDDVDLLGSLAGESKWNEFRKANIFCLPTYATEAMPVSIIEAMMFSLPTVTTEWRSIPDMITDGEEGFLVPVKDAKALAEKLLLLIKTPELATQMGESARRRFESAFNLEKHLEKMRQIFVQI